MRATTFNRFNHPGRVVLLVVLAFVAFALLACADAKPNNPMDPDPRCEYCVTGGMIGGGFVTPKTKKGFYAALLVLVLLALAQIACAGEIDTGAADFKPGDALGFGDLLDCAADKAQGKGCD